MKELVAPLEMDGLDDVDSGVRELVALFRAAGVETCMSCQGGPGHDIENRTVAAYVDEHDPMQTMRLMEDVALRAGYRNFDVLLEASSLSTGWGGCAPEAIETLVPLANRLFAKWREWPAEDIAYAEERARLPMPGNESQPGGEGLSGLRVPGCPGCQITTSGDCGQHGPLVITIPSAAAGDPLPCRPLPVLQPFPQDEAPDDLRQFLADSERKDEEIEARDTRIAEPVVACGALGEEALSYQARLSRVIEGAKALDEEIERLCGEGVDLSEENERLKNEIAEVKAESAMLHRARALVLDAEEYAWLARCVATALFVNRQEDRVVHDPVLDRIAEKLRALAPKEN